MSLYFWKRVWDCNTRRCFFCQFWSSIHNNYFYYQLSSLIKQLWRTGGNILLCVSSWQSKVVEQQQEDEAITVLVFHSPKDLRHWPCTAGEGWAFVTQNFFWLLLSQERLSSFKVRKEILLALERSKPGFGQQAVWKCAWKMLQCGFAAPWGKETSLCCWTILKLFNAVTVLDYTAGRELEKEKQYTLFSKFEMCFCFWTSRSISWSILLSVKAGNVAPNHSSEYYFSEKASFWNQHPLIYQTLGKETYQWYIIWWWVAVLINTCFADTSFYWRRRKNTGKMRIYIM